MTWIAIKDNNTMLSPKFIKSTNKNPKNFRILILCSPKGNVMGCMEWTFLNEYGNETDIPRLMFLLVILKNQGAQDQHQTQLVFIKTLQSITKANIQKLE